MRASTIALAGGLNLPLISALAFPGPVPTSFELQDLYKGFNPKPTPAPHADFVAARQASSAAESISVGANTCGWVDGQPDAAIFCGSTRTCMLYTPENIIGMAGCCESSDLQNCGWNTGCIDREAFSTWSGPLDEFQIYCTESTAQYCVSWTYPVDQIKDHGCGTDSASTWDTIEKSLSTSGITTSVSLTYVPESAVTGWRAEEKSTRSINTSQRSTATDEDGGLQTGGTNIIVPSNSSSNDDSGISTGAIVGAVIGGLAALIIVVGAIFFFCWRRRRAQRQNAATAPTGAPVMAQQGVYAQQQQQQPQYYPPPQGQYPPPQASYYPSPPMQDQDPTKYNPATGSPPPPQSVQPYYAPAQQPGQPQTSPNPQGAGLFGGQQSPVAGNGPHSPVVGGGAQQQQPPQQSNVHELG